MKKLTLSLLTLISFSLVAQQNAKEGKIKDAAQTKNAIKFTPLKTIGQHHSALEFSYQRFLSDKKAIQITYGRLLNQFDKNKNDNIDFKGHSFAIEHRWYKEKNKPLYTSLELGGIFRRGNQVGNFDNTTVRDSLGNIKNFSYEDTINVRYQQLYLSYKVGWEKKYDNGFVIDTYVGLGLAHVLSIHRDRINSNDKYNDPTSGAFLIFDNDYIRYSIVEDKMKFRPKFLFNIRVGYSF